MEHVQVMLLAITLVHVTRAIWETNAKYKTHVSLPILVSMDSVMEMELEIFNVTVL